MDMEAPGLVLAPRRRRWGKLCERLDLPPPLAWTPGRALVQALVLAPTPRQGLELLVVPVPGLSASELTRVTARVEAIRHLAQRHAAELDIRLCGEGELTSSLFAWAAIIGGELPTIHDGPLDWFDVLARAPTPLLRSLTLLVARNAPPPLEALALLRHARAVPFLAAWSRNDVVRDVAALDRQPLSSAELDGLIQRFRGAMNTALRLFPVHERKGIRQLLKPALGSAYVPTVFRHHLDRLISQKAPKQVQLERSWQLELEGLVLARASSLDQLRASAVAESPRLAAEQPVWQRLAQLCQLEGPRALVLIEPGFLRHLVIVIPRSRRPRVRRTDAAGVLQFCLSWHRAGVPVELMPAPGCDPTLITRAAQLLAVPMRRDETVALQLGTTVMRSEPGRTRTLPLERAFRRPRQLLWLCEQAELNRALRKPMATGLPTVQVVAWPDGDQHAMLYCIDAQGSLFAERVRREVLEQTLTEYRALLRTADVPALVTATVHPLLTSLAGRRVEGAAPVLLTLVGDQVELEGERFGPRAELNWSALAESILSQWAPGVWAHVGVSGWSSVPGAARVSALSLLALRSRVLRRVDVQLRRIARSLAAA